MIEAGRTRPASHPVRRRLLPRSGRRDGRLRCDSLSKRWSHDLALSRHFAGPGPGVGDLLGLQGSARHLALAVLSDLRGLDHRGRGGGMRSRVPSRSVKSREPLGGTDYRLARGVDWL
jgi:hypothetical protein